jgi:osmoprotectant transport system permease protein
VIHAIVAWLSDPAHWSGPSGIPQRVLEHLEYSAVTLVIAALIAIPLGMYVGHAGRGRTAVSVANSLRAVPSLDLLFAIALWVGPWIHGGLAFTLPSIIVLVLLAIPPILSGTYAGVGSVDPAARDAAVGMGMRGPQVLWRVELPIALPLLISGLRSAALQVIATATIAAAVGLGGLGRYLIDGLALQQYDTVASGAVVVAVLALVVDLLFAGVERLVVSPGLTGRADRGGGRRGRGSGTGGAPVETDSAGRPVAGTEVADAH